MSESNEKPLDDDKKERKTLSLGAKRGTLGLKEGGPSRQGIAVEVIRSKRHGPTPSAPEPAAAPVQTSVSVSENDDNLTSEEREARLRAVRGAIAAEEQRRKQMEEESRLRAENEVVEQPAPEELVVPEPEPVAAPAEERTRPSSITIADPLPKTGITIIKDAPPKQVEKARPSYALDDQEEEESFRSRMKRTAAKAPPAPRKPEDDKRKPGRITVTQALNEDFERDRSPSLAAQRRAREKARLMGAKQSRDAQPKFAREVVVPETITVQELANRMAERSGDIVKSLMKMGVMATITQTIDADTAELVIMEFGHKIKRVSDSDIEVGIGGPNDNESDRVTRPPVVTIMGHVDHGKTSLLDALRQTDVVSGEAGGITQHIGAYQVVLASGQKITFLDTPGHAAFSEMRARGANVTDVVVLVVAANDGIMPQTIEAISHAKAAGVPIIVAVNKIDLPDANPVKVKQALLQYEIVVEEMGGETQCVEISAKKRMNLDKLEEAIVVQAEILELKANPNRVAEGAIVESRLEQGRGPVATVLVQNGTLKVGDIFVAGGEWGRVRALIDDRGHSVQQAVPGQPVEVMGLNGTPNAGDILNVTVDEAQARDIAEYRQRKKREALNVARAKAKGSFEQLLAQSREDAGKQELAVIIKADVHGSVEAIQGSLQKLTEENKELAVRILHAAVGGITESDVTLAKASNAFIIGFNVRANAQARDMAQKAGVEIRYYNIIYNVIDDVKAVLSGMLSPSEREVYLGQAEIRQVFNITKVGKVGGCMVTQGEVKRGARVRLLRDHVVIHEGTLKTLKRFKDEVKEVREGAECGMAFENYEDIKEGDIIECYNVVQEARTLA